MRFVPVDELPPPPAPTALPSAARPPALEVLEPGLLTTIQDHGRPGWRRAGVSGGDSAGYCAQRYKSYDPASGTYLGYDGQRHPCP